MTDDLEFRETDQPREFRVTDAELRTLRRVKEGLVVQPGSAGMVLVGPKAGYAGSVLLPTGRRVIVLPKVAIDSVPELLALAFATKAPPASFGSTSVEEATPTDWLILQLVDEVLNLLGRGLRRGYVERQERLPFVRGRAQVPLNPAKLPFLDCRFSDFTSDTPENQALCGVLHHLLPVAKNTTVRRRLIETLEAFAEVSRIRPSMNSIDRIQLTRLNQYYEPSLRLARLALQGAGVTDSAGPETAPAYFLQMWEVWEQAVASALSGITTRKIARHYSYVDKIAQTGGLPQLNVVIKPDVVIGPRARPDLILELKWSQALRDRRGMERLVNDHLYQVATYCAALNCDGVLLYPQMGAPVNSVYQFGGRSISVRTVDLTRPKLAGLNEAMRDIIAGLEATQVRVPGRDVS